MDRLTNDDTVVVNPALTANCNTHQLHCEDCDCEVMDCGFIRDALNRLCEYENTGLSPEICANYKKFEDEAIGKNVTFNRIVELMEAEAEGRLIVLPVKVGDTVWFDTWERGIKNIGIQPHKIDRVDITVVSEANEFVPTNIPLWELGKTVFTSREAAEAALKEAQG